MTRRRFLESAGAVSAGAALGLGSGGRPAWAVAGSPGPDKPSPNSALVAGQQPHVAQAWLRELYRLVKLDGYAPPDTAPSDNPDGYDHLTGFTPTSAARLYGYFGIALYEALLPGMPGNRSLSGQLTGMPRMPGRPAGKPLDWPTVVSGVTAAVVGPMFNRARSRVAVTAFEAQQVAARRAAGVAADVVEASLAHGRNVAAALQPWIAADGYAAIRAKFAREDYTPPVGEGLWVPTPPNFGPAIEPYWGEMRPLVLRTAGEVSPEQHVPFSTEVGSPMWLEAKSVYDQHNANPSGSDNRHIARFWTDNPVQSGLPSGHWMLIVGQFAAQHGLRLDRAAEGYALTGIALADAFLSCWYEKYQSNLLRPVTYVRRYIDPTWSTFVNTPQFPEYTSGHSVSSVAAAKALTSLFGHNKAFTDTHDLPNFAAAENVPRTRTFASFLAAADMAAQSRIYGGIHYPMGVEAGKEQGAKLGDLVVQRVRLR